MRTWSRSGRFSVAVVNLYVVDSDDGISSRAALSFDRNADFRVLFDLRLFNIEPGFELYFYLFLLSRRSSSTGAVSDHAIVVFKMFAVHEVDRIRRRPNSWLALGINPLPNRSFRFRVIFSDVNDFYEESHRSIFIVAVKSTRLKKFYKEKFCLHSKV